MGFGKFLKRFLPKKLETKPLLPSELSTEDVDKAGISTTQRLTAAKQQHREGQITEAEGVYREVLRDDPGNADARHMLSLVKMQRGELHQAEEGLRQAIELDGEQADYHSNLGNVLVAQEKYGDALASFQAATGLDSQHVAALGNCATVLLTLGRPQEAEASARKLLQLIPDEPNAQLNLSAALMEQDKVRDAIEIARKGVDHNPQHVGLLLQLASALELVNELDEALTIVQQAEKLAPALPRVSLISGVVQRRLGKLELAEQHLRRALEQGLSTHEQIEANNQLGLTLDAQGSISDAFSAFEQSNQLLAQGAQTHRADAGRFLLEVSANLAFFSKEKFRVLNQTTIDDDFAPVFFVGFPRSGTTLLEQILKQHPQLVTSDEVSPLASVIGEFRKTSEGYPGEIAHCATEDWEQLRQYFIQLSQQRLGDLKDRRLVDKLPLNLVHLGLANLLFPRAKVIVALRDPRDVCLSCFMQKFKINDAMINFLDIQSTAHAYDAVMGLWLHYRDVLQIPWMEYKYENLVSDFDQTVRDVLNFIGVEWDDAIHDYRAKTQQTVVTTPSYRDVTAPINDHAVGRWHAYEKELASIMPILAPYVEKFNYGSTR